MKWLIFGISLSLVSTLALITGCASTGSGTQSTTETKDKVSSTNDNLTLEDYLRRLSSVKVIGSGGNLSVTIRGNMSVTNDEDQPLFILNGQKVGHNFSRVSSMVSKGSIISVEAIPASRASIYGMEGGSGVIVIKTD